MPWSGYTEAGGGSEQRGPSSFSFDVPEAPKAQGRQAVMQRGGREQGLQTFQVDSGAQTLDALSKIAVKTMAPLVEDLKDKAFLEGLQRAASGEALDEIIADQPWYTRIFGESASIEGARAYTKEAESARIFLDVDQHLRDNPGTPPDAVPQLIMDTVKEHLTGDPQTDAALHMAALKNVAPTAKAQTKQYVKYIQEQNYQAFSQNGTDKGNLLQATMSQPDLYGPGDIGNRQADLLMDLQRPEGMDVGSYRTALTSWAKGQALAGNFHTLQTAADGGLFRELTPEQQQAVDQTVTQQARQHARDGLLQYTGPEAALKMQARRGELSAAEVMQQYDAWNADFTAKTGNPLPIFGNSIQVSDAMTAMQAVDARLAAVARQAATAQTEEEIMRRVRIAVATGNSATAGAALKAQGVPQAQALVDHEIYTEWQARNASGDVAGMADIMAHDAKGNRAVPRIATEVATLVNSWGDTPNDNFYKSYSLYNALQAADPDTESRGHAVGVYFPPDKAARLQRFHEELGGRDIVEGGAEAFELSKGIYTKNIADLPKAEAKAFQKLLNKEVFGKAVFGNPDVLSASGQPMSFTGVKPYAGTMNLVTRTMGGRFHTAKQGGIDDKTAFNQAQGGAQAAGLELVGPFGWMNGKGRPTVYDELKNQMPGEAPGDSGELPEDAHDTAFNRGAPLGRDELSDSLQIIVNTKALETTGKKPEDVIFTRGANNSGGVPVLYATYRVNGVSQGPIPITGDAILQQAQANRQDATYKAGRLREHELKMSMGNVKTSGPKDFAQRASER